MACRSLDQKIYETAVVILYKGGWVPGLHVHGRDKNGRAVEALSLDAVSFSAIGAVSRAAYMVAGKIAGLKFWDRNFDDLVTLLQMNNEETERYILCALKVLAERAAKRPEARWIELSGGRSSARRHCRRDLAPLDKDPAHRNSEIRIAHSQPPPHS